MSACAHPAASVYANLYADVKTSVSRTHLHMHWCSKSPVDACHTVRKKCTCTRACVPRQWHQCHTQQRSTRTGSCGDGNTGKHDVTDTANPCWVATLNTLFELHIFVYDICYRNSHTKFDVLKFAVTINHDLFKNSGKHYDLLWFHLENFGTFYLDVRFVQIGPVVCDFNRLDISTANCDYKNVTMD